MNIDVYKDGISFATNDVSSILTSEANLNENNRVKFVTDLAAISRGLNESKNPVKRYKALLSEAAPSSMKIIGDEAIGTPSRPLEFLPVVMEIGFKETNSKMYISLRCIKDPLLVYDYTLDFFVNNIGRFSFIKDNLIHTNMRCLINAGMKYEDIPYNTKEELKDFRIAKVNLPMFVWAQLMTHTAISKESQSDRVSTTDAYWLPGDFIDRCEKIVKDLNVSIDVKRQCIQIVQNANNLPMVKELLYTNFTSVGIVELFKNLGYGKEIYQRAIYYFKYKKMIMTGWNNDPKVWEHLFIERSTEPDIWKNWSQMETVLAVDAIKKIINKKGN